MTNLPRFPPVLRWAALLTVAVGASGCAVYPAYPGYQEQVAVGPAPGVVYAPGPMYGPAPVYVAPPVYYGPPPVSLSLGLGFGFRGGHGGRHHHHRYHRR
jgi:hypothetical protein